MKVFIQFNKAATRHQRAFMEYKPSEMHVLHCLKGWGDQKKRELTVSEISKTLQVTSPTVTQLIKGLEARGVIERRIDPTDRRVVYLHLTPKGEMITQKSAQELHQRLNGLVEYLGEEQSEQFAELLVQVLAYFTKEHNENHWSQRSGDEEV
jgi:DNA-binding MarR family transcriptional regulator